MNAPIPLCVFAKPPIPGTVKTRLIPMLGADSAAALASAMLNDIWQTISDIPNAYPVLATTGSGDFSSRAARNELSSLVVGQDGIVRGGCQPPPENIWLQGDGDLGAKIERIIRRALQHAPAALAIGADSPALAHSEVCSAIQALRSHDAVIGRCHDGGFYLLGLRSCREGLLAGIPWSCAETSSAIMTRLLQEGFSVTEVGPTFDVDVPDDLTRLSEALRQATETAPATRAWLMRTTF